MKTGTRQRAIGNSKKTKIVGFVLSAMLFAPCVSAQAQQPTKLWRVGYISGTGDAKNQGPYVEALRQGLRELGYNEGKNFAIEYRGAEGKLEPVPNLVTELVQLKVDVLVLPLNSAVRVAARTTKSIPIVMVTQVDPERRVWSIAWPSPAATSPASRHWRAT